MENNGKKIRNHAKAEKGFTLIEVLIAIIVLAVILIGAVMANLAIQKNSEAAFQRTRAMQDANQVMEAIRKTARTGNFPSNVIAVYPNGGSVSGMTSLNGESATVSYSDTNGDGNALTDNPLDITVTVSWLENGTRPASSSLRALVMQR